MTDIDESCSEKILTSEQLGKTLVEKVTPQDFDFVRVIGKGTFGKVYQAYQKDTNNVYAIKVLNKRFIIMHNQAQHIMSERNVLLTNLQHPFLVGLHYSFQTKTKLYFVLDLVTGGELFYHLQKEKRIKEKRARFYVAEIVSALGYLHEKNIIYRDLKPENILLDAEGHVKLTDFGLSKDNISPNQKVKTFCGTPEYLAPEILLKQGYRKEVDWWTLGCVFFEMVFGIPPFYSRNRNKMFHAIVHNQVKFKESVNISTACGDFINDLLRKNPNLRLGSGERDAEAVKEHSYLSDINFEKLERKELKTHWNPKTRQDELKYVDPNVSEEKVTDSVKRNSSAGGIYGSGLQDPFIGFTYVRPNTEYGL